MRMVNVDKNIITKLRESGISDEMKSIESIRLADYSMRQSDNEIIGVAAEYSTEYFILHSIYTFIKNIRGKGYGTIKIQKELVNEARKRNYSFLSTVFVDPR